MKYLFSLILFFSCFNIYGQNDSVILLKEHPYKVTYFQPCYSSKYVSMPDTNCKNLKTWKPCINELLKIDKHIKQIVRKYKQDYLSQKNWEKDILNKRNFNAWKKNRRYILWNINRYNRQFEVGINDENEILLFINCYRVFSWMDIDENMPDAKIECPKGGGSGYFHIIYNYSQKKTSYIWVHFRR